MTNRIAAVFIAAIAMAGLIVQFAVSYRLHSSALLTLWTLLEYFTITTNLLVAVVFIGIALYGSRPASLVAGTMLSILLVGVIYTFLLHGQVELSGGSQIANVLLHFATPILVPLFWVIFTPKGALKWSQPFLCAIYPLLYLLYALIRGGITGKYAYPFLNVLQFGWGQILLNSLIIGVAFLLSGLAVVWLDRKLAPTPAAVSI
jgi:hypothetical protein